MNQRTVEDIKYAMQNRVGIRPEKLSGSLLREAGCLNTVCILPEGLNERLSYLADVLVQAITRTPKDDELRFAVGQLCQTLSYMMNSASWRDGRLHDFDREELRRRLGRLSPDCNRT